MSETKDPQIAALLREREGYVRYGKPDRVKAVDAELKRLGHSEPKKSEPKKRASAAKSTADDSPKSSA